MKTNHTPGPWTAEQTDLSEITIESENLTIGTALVIDISEEEGEANARLMAAAPDLLTALQFAEEYLSSPAFVALHGDTASRKARAAITKATAPQ